MGSEIGSAPPSAPPSGRPSFEIGTGRAPPPSVRGYALGSDMGSDMGSEMGSAPASGRPSFDIGEGRPSFDIGERPVRESFDVGSGRPSFDFGGAQRAGLVSRPLQGSGSDLAGSGAQTPASSRPASMDYQFRAPPPSVQGHELGSDFGSDIGSDIGSRPASLDYGRRAPPPSLAGGGSGSRTDLQSMGRPSFDIGSGRPSFEIGGRDRPSFDIGSGRPSFDISGLHNLQQGQDRGQAGRGPQGHQVRFAFDSRHQSMLGPSPVADPQCRGILPIFTASCCMYAKKLLILSAQTSKQFSLPTAARLQCEVLVLLSSRLLYADAALDDQHGIVAGCLL